MRTSWRYILIGLCASALAGASIYSIDGTRVITDAQALQVTLIEWVEGHRLASGIGYVLFAATGMLTPLPSAVFVMLVGGFLFGPAWGGLLAATGASLSAVVVYCGGRALFARFAEKLLSSSPREVRYAIAENAFGCLLALRLLPGMPAWLSNLVPVPLVIPIRTVVMATFLGILPICLLVGAVGDGLATFSAIGDQPATALLLRPSLLAPLLGLFALTVVSLAAKRRLRRLRS